MTVSSTNRKQNFDGGQAELEFTFRALPEAPEDIKCIATSDAGVITYLEYNVDYTVAVNSDGIGGTVTLNPTFATTYTHTVYRETTIKQESDYDDYNPFPADTLETNIDRLTMIAQEERELGERTLKYPISSTGTDTNLPVPEAGKFIAWNAAGDGMENKDIPDPSTLIKASQAEAEAGTDNDNFMTPLRTKQAITALQDDDIPLSYLSTSGTLADNSDVKVASQKATKTYADTKLPSSYLDTDGDLTANSDVKVPSQKAVKTYVDAKVFGNWASRNEATNYTASTDGFFVGVIVASNSGYNTGHIKGLTDTNDTPTTVRASANVHVHTGQNSQSQYNNYNSFTLPVKSGEKYRATYSGTGTITRTYYWIPLGA